MRSLILALGLALGFAATPASAHHLGELRIGTEPGYAPFEYKNDKGELIGFDIDVGNALCEKLHMKCVWVEQPFESLISGLNTRKFDVIHASMNITEARKKVVSFSHPVYAIPTQLLAPVGSGLAPTAASLKGKRVGALLGSAQEAFAKKAWARKGVKIVSYADQDQTFIDLKAGRLDAAIVEKPNALSGFLNKPEGAGYEFVGEPIVDPLLVNDIGMAIRKADKKLKQQIDKAILELRAEGRISEFAKKYFSPGELELFSQ